MFVKKYIFGDTAVYFVECPVEGHEKTTTVGLAAFPKDIEIDPKTLRCDSLVQVAFTGDDTLIDYTRGVTMRNRRSSVLKIVKQVEFSGGRLNTYLTDGAGNDYVHRLSYDRLTGVFTVNVRYENHTKSPRTLEYLASASLSGIASPFDMTTRGLSLHRMTSAWSRECRLKTDTFAQLGLDMSWGRYGVKAEKWGQVGSMPNRGYFPFAAIEDVQSGTIWGFMAEAPASWQMEVYEEKETCAFSCGLADYEFGHWRKTIPAGLSFTTQAARFVVGRGGGVNAVCNAFVHEQDMRLSVPRSEEEMPVIYNEYCATWGTPTEKKVERQLKSLDGLNIKYFVIDAGWYKPLDRSWVNAAGDWNVNPEYFPDIKSTVAKINASGMKAGIWFEYEVAGRDSTLFEYENEMLHRDGAVLTCKNRRFLDLRKSEVKEYLQFKMNDFLRDNGFEYLKIDYNDSFGMGCDGAESLGEGGRQVAEESINWLDRLARDIPGIVIENCSSGGSRIEPYRMSKVSMCSFSDAHECPEIPLVAANVSRVIPARQSQIWAVIRKGEEDSRTIYSLCAAMIGRICLSGDIKKEKHDLIKEGLDFYAAVKDIVRRGDIAEIDCDVEYYRNPVGRQIYIKELGDRRLVIVHFLGEATRVRIPMEGYAVTRAFTDLKFKAADGQLRIAGEDFHAGAFLLEKLPPEAN